MIRLGIMSLDHPHAVGNHIPALKQIEDRIKVAAIYHSDREEAQKWMKLLSADFCEDKERLVLRKDIDAILITSKNSAHSRDSIMAAEGGKDVFCDKPIATTVQDALAIVSAVKKKKVVFITTFPVRYNASILKLKKAVDQRVLGRITAVMATNHGCMYEPDEPSWVRDPSENGGGCIIDHTVHVADIIRWITGAEFASVKAEAMTSIREIAAEDIGILHGLMTDGTLFQIDASWSRKKWDPMWGDVTFRIVGTEGSATLDLYNNQKIELYSRSGIEFRYPNHLVREHGDVFLNYLGIREGQEDTIAANAVDGLRTIELVSAAYKSIQTNKWVEVEHNSC